MSPSLVAGPPGAPMAAAGPRASLALCFLSLCLALTSCAWWRPGVPGPQGPLREATAAELVQILEAREKRLRTVKGLFTARVKSPSLPIAQTVYGTLFYRRGDALRLQGFDRFGGRIFDFLLEPGRYEVVLPTEGRSITGSPAELAGRGEVGDSVRLSVLAMSGLLGIASVKAGALVSLTEDGDLYRLDVRAPGEGPVRVGPMRRQIWFERRELLVVRERRFSASGELVGTLELEDFRTVPPASAPPGGVVSQAAASSDLRLPFTLGAESGDGEGEIRITFSELHPNVPLRDTDLSLAERGTAPGSRSPV